MSELIEAMPQVIAGTEGAHASEGSKLPLHADPAARTDELVEEVRSRILILPQSRERAAAEAIVKSNRKQKTPAPTVSGASQASQGQAEKQLPPEKPPSWKERRKIKLQKKILGKSKAPKLKVTLCFEEEVPEAPPKSDCAASSSEAICVPELARLEQLGYSELAQALQSLRGLPIFERILHFRNPLLIEQLTDLYNLMGLTRERYTSQESEKIIQVAMNIAAKESGEQSQLIGKLIFLADHLSKDELMSGINAEETLSSFLSDKFSEVLKHSFAKIHELKRAHKLTGLQDPNISLRNHLPVILSEILISSSGRVNVGICDEMAKEALPEWIFPDQYKQNLLRLLEEFKTRPGLREQIARIKGPKSDDAPSAVVIRASLGMRKEDPVTEASARRAAFAALASHLRQGSDGSCFATPLEIILLSSSVERCLEDFASILEFNKLTRRIDHGNRDFPFLLRMSGNKLEKTLTVNSEGKINPEEQEEGFLFDAPGVIAACRAIGIESPKSAVKETLRAHFNFTDEPLLKITLKHLLQKLVLYSKSLECNRSAGIGTLYLRASFAFESQESNPLLQVWENAIAGMAEPDETGMVLSAVIDAVKATMKTKLRELYPSKPALRKLMRNEIEKELRERVHLQYDPVISSREDPEDKKSKEGAFVLYDKNHKTNPQEWARIDNPHSFREFISEIIREANTQLAADARKTGSKDAGLQTRAMEKLGLFATTDYFVISCLQHYYDRNKDYPDPINHFEEIKYAPWVTKSGNDFSKVIQAYFEEFNTSNSQVFSPKSVKELLLKVVEVGKTIKKHGNEKFDHSPHQLIPVRIQGVHAFNIMLSHPTMSDIWSQSDAFSHWLNRKILLPGKQIAETSMSHETKDTVVRGIVEQMIPKEMEGKVQKELQKIADGLPVREFRERTVSLLSTLFTEDEIAKTDLCDQVDMILLESLPDEVQSRVRASALHFADTNWSDGIHDIHLCFIVSPGTGDLEMWAVYDNNRKFFPVSKEQWISGKKWEFFIEIARAYT